MSNFIKGDDAQDQKERKALRSDRLIRAKAVLTVKRFKTSLDKKAKDLQLDTEFSWELKRLQDEIETFLEDQDAGDHILDGPEGRSS